MSSPPATPPREPPANGGLDRARPLLAAVVLAVAGVLLFARLGHYALWDDEANTALSAQGVLRTGDTSAWVSDHNLLAYRRGAELKDLHLRYLPPLQAYVAAPSLALFGASAWAARLPFALCGLAAIALLLWWLWRARAGGTLWLLMAMGLVGNVSLFLYLRNARYYALAILASLVVAYCYARRSTLRAWAPLAALASVALLASNYLNYAALCAVLAADYALWGRRERPIATREWLVLLAPQLLAAALIVPVWNPLTQQVEAASDHWLAGRATLLAWFLRDLNACEFAALPMLLAAALLSRREPALARGSVAAAVYLLAITLAAPQAPEAMPAAPVRYLVPLIPLFIFLQARVLAQVARRSLALAVAGGALVFGSNVIHGGPLTGEPFRYSLARYAGELLNPPPDPYTEASRWIAAHVRAGESVWVMPPYMKYPLMFHAPQPVYAWQLAWPPAQPQFEGLPGIHFENRVRPDYVVAFGPVVGWLLENGFLRGMEPAALLDIYWKDWYRPELIHRSSRPIRNFDPARDAVYIFRSASRSGAPD